MSFLLDTDTCSAHLKHKGAVTSKFLQHSGRLHVSVITVGELLTWALRAKAPPRRVHGIQTLLNDVALLNVSEDIAREFGRLRAHLLDIGRPTPETTNDANDTNEAPRKWQKEGMAMMRRK